MAIVFMTIDQEERFIYQEISRMTYPANNSWIAYPADNSDEDIIRLKEQLKDKEDKVNWQKEGF